MADEGSSMLSQVVQEIVQSPVNLVLIAVIALLVYKILQSHIGSKKVSTYVPEPELPRLQVIFPSSPLCP